ncbi:MAG: hypothetical protein IPK72_21360 [Candidatus Eisenbacteria bacterium]|nr:hypothetical protein [Candidatus Eisenbacteria bacterium]
MVLASTVATGLYVWQLHATVAEKSTENEALRARETIAALRASAENDLWPMRSETIPALRAWLKKAEDLDALLHATRARGIAVQIPEDALQSFFTGPRRVRFRNRRYPRHQRARGKAAP